MIRVLLTAPLKQDPRFFKEYQESIDNLIIPEGVELSRFFVVNDCPEVIPLIHDAEHVVRNTGDKYVKNNRTHIWTEANLNKMPALRNETIRKALDDGFDYWWSVDTDLVLRPQTLKVLLDADKDIVTEAFWTDGWCNAWEYDQAKGAKREWKTPGLYKIGASGACTLVKRKVLEAGVDYTPIPLIRKALYGEDRHFCIRANVLGFEHWLDSHCPPTHLYTENHYQLFMKYEKGMKSNGDDRRRQSGDEDHSRRLQF